MSELIYLFDPICQRFNEIPWHDSELRSLTVSGKEESDYSISMDLGLVDTRGHSEFISAQLKFTEARIFKADFDLMGLGCCGGSIASAVCKLQSDFMKRTEFTLIENSSLRPEVEPLRGMKHFRILLINPGGEMDIIAKDFELILL